MMKKKDLGVLSMLFFVIAISLYLICFIYIRNSFYNFDFGTNIIGGMILIYITGRGGFYLSIGGVIAAIIQLKRRRNTTAITGLILNSILIILGLVVAYYFGQGVNG